MARHRDFTASAQRVPVDRGDDRLREPLDLPYHAVPEADERVDVTPGERRAQVGAGAEDAVTRPGDDDGADRVVVLHRGERRVQLSQDQPGADALLEHVVDHVEIGGDFVRGGAAEELLPLPQLDLDDLGEIGILLEYLEMEGHDLPDLRQRIALGGELLPYQRYPLRHLLAEQGDEDLVLGLEVEVDRAARDARLAGDVRDARVVVAAAGEDADRGGNDLVGLVGIAHQFSD